MSAAGVVRPTSEDSAAVPPARIRLRWWTLLGGVVASVGTAVLATWPLATALDGAVPTNQWHCLGRGCEDEFLCVWIVVEGAKRLLRSPGTLFEANILHPLKHVLAYSETMLTSVVMASPFVAAGHPVLGYGVVYLAAVMIAALGTFLLVHHVTGDPRAAMLAGMMLGLSSEYWYARGHLARISIQWVPFVCWTWLRFLDVPRARRGLALGLALIANFHAGVYQGLLLPIVLAPWAGVLMAARLWPWRSWWRSLAVLAAASVVALVGYLPWVVVRDELGFVPKGPPGVIGWSWYLDGLTRPAEWVASLQAPGRDAHWVSPLPLMLAVLAVLVAGLRRPALEVRRAQAAHALAAGAFMLAAAACTVFEPELGPAAVLMHWLMLLPGYDALRSRDRMALVYMAGAALLAGIALAAVLRRIRRRWVGAVVAVVVGILIVLDSRVLREPMPLTWLPRREDLPPAVGLATLTHGAILHLPYGTWPYEALYMMWSLQHDQPIMNGYTAVMPRFGHLVSDIPSKRASEQLDELGVRAIIVHGALVGDFPLAQAHIQRVLTRSGLPSLRFGDDVLLLRPAPTARPTPAGPPGHPIDPHGWRIEASEPGAAAAADGRIETHWTAPSVDRDSFLRIDLGAERLVSGVVLRFGPHLTEIPANWAIFTSLDGATWSPAGADEGVRMPFASYLRDHRDIEMSLPVTPVRARWVELRVRGIPILARLLSHVGPRWGVHEISVLDDGAT